MGEYRYRVSDNGTITRGCLYRIDDPDQWSYFTDGDSWVGFYDEGHRGARPMNDSTDSARLLNAWTHDRAGVDRAARRIAAEQGCRGDAATVLTVHLARGMDLIVVCWGGAEHERSLRDDIEAVWHGDVYRIECEELVIGASENRWEHADDICDEFYGDTRAEAALAREFPLAEFPAELTI